MGWVKVETTERIRGHAALGLAVAAAMPGFFRFSVAIANLAECRAGQTLASSAHLSRVAVR